MRSGLACQGEPAAPWWTGPRYAHYLQVLPGKPWREHLDSGFRKLGVRLGFAMCIEV